jgi:hypothetical protein
MGDVEVVPDRVEGGEDDEDRRRAGGDHHHHAREDRQVLVGAQGRDDVLDLGELAQAPAPSAPPVAQPRHACLGLRPGAQRAPRPRGGVRRGAPKGPGRRGHQSRRIDRPA